MGRQSTQLSDLPRGSRRIATAGSQLIDDDADLIDMGNLDEDDHKYLIVDKDTGIVYDMRNEEHIEYLTSELTTTSLKKGQKVKNMSDWSEWWQKKKKSNQDFLMAAEHGDVSELARLLNKEELRDLAAELNARSQVKKWHALHHSSFFGQVDAFKFIYELSGVDKHPLTTK
jgi:hypothetical protein